MLKRTASSLVPNQSVLNRLFSITLRSVSNKSENCKHNQVPVGSIEGGLSRQLISLQGRGLTCSDRVGRVYVKLVYVCKVG